MASLDRNAPRTGRQRFAALAMIVMATAVSGCAGSKDGMATSAITDDYRQRHPIVLTDKEHRVDIPVSVSDRRLTSGMRDTVRGFVQDYRAHATGTVEIMTRGIGEFAGRFRPAPADPPGTGGERHPVGAHRR